MSETSPRLTIRPFRPEDADAVAAILWAAFDAGELRGSTRTDVEHWLLGLAGDPERNLVAVAQGEVAGLLSLPVDHLVVGERFRRQGIGTQLIGAAEALVAERGIGPLYLALPRDNNGGRAFYDAIGYAYHHSLWHLRLEADVAVPPPAFPSSVQRRTYEPSDLEPFVAMVNTIFLDHPSPLTLTLDQTRFAHDRPSFDPESLLLLSPTDAPDNLIAFCRAAVEVQDGERVGHIPLLGVRREWRKLGLGQELLRWGVWFARERGAGAVSLAAESGNVRALRIYEDAGFVRVEEWLRYGRAA